MKKLLAILMICLSTNAMSGILIDPFIGYSMGDASGDNKTDFSGTEVGSRLAYSMLGLYGGVDFRLRNFDADKGDNITDDGRIALVVGYEFPILVRAFATYGIINSAKIGSSDLDIDNDITLGVGFTGLPFIALNFEMSSFHANKLANSTINSDFSMYLFSVSLPISL